ncbi:MAG TPA: hypothetical protein VF534_01210 [Paraburkholderia sp.]
MGSTFPGISQALADARYAQQSDLPGVNAARAGIDITGVTNVSTALYNLLYLTQNVYLPPGLYNVTGADGFKPPSNCRMYGVRPTFTMNGTGGGTFSGGSVLVGSGPSVLNVGNRSGLNFSDFGVNATAALGNAVQGLGPNTQNLKFSGLVTNGTNHNYLFEQYNNDPLGGSGGGITIENFELHGGPNGIAIKCANVLVKNGIAHDIGVQCYVAVSDNIETPNLYNRAQNVTFENCLVGLRCASGGRLYSRDCWSTTNANGVQPAVNIRYIGGSYSYASAYGIMIGDEASLETTPLSGSAAAGQTRLLSQDVFIDVEALNNGRNGIRVACGQRVRVRGSVGGNGTSGTVNGVVYTNNNISADITGSLQQGGLAVQDFRIADELAVSGTAAGMEIQSLMIPVGSASVNLGARAQVYETQNVTVNYLNAVVNPQVGQEFWIQINDNYTLCQLAPNTPQFCGIGTMVRYRCVDSSGTMLLVGAFEPLGKSEVNRAFNTTFYMNATIGAQAQNCNVTGNFTIINLYPPLVPIARDGWSLRLMAGTSARTITAWAALFKWPAAQFPSGAPTSIAANTTLLITFFWDGTYMVAKGSWVY